MLEELRKKFPIGSEWEVNTYESYEDGSIKSPNGYKLDGWDKVKVVREVFIDHEGYWVSVYQETDPDYITHSVDPNNLSKYLGD